jgi:hypothetical protein
MVISIATALPIVGIVLVVALARTVHWRLFQQYFKVTYTNSPVWTFLYFGAVSFLLIAIFPELTVRLFHAVTPVGYLILLFLFVVAFPATYRLLRETVGVPKWLADMTPDEPILTLGERFILAKVADVLMQELAAGMIILTLSASGVTYPFIVLVSIIVFGAAHLYIFATSGFFWGLYYTTYGALAGFAIPFLILFVPAGIAYALVLHMLFYVLSAALFAKFPQPSVKVRHDLAVPAL